MGSGSSPRRRILLAIGVATAMVVVLATLFPRGYLANDDIGFTEYLRKNTYTPWISPILAQAFGLAYQHAPGVPWFGLFQYALIVATGAVLIHTCMELIDQRPGLGRMTTLLGAIVIGASHAIVVIGITWTTVSISALGTAMAAFVAHAQISQATGRPMSPVRALVYGLVFVSGYMLRLQGLGGMVVALVPVLAWTAWRFGRQRHLPRISAMIAFVAPFLLVFAIQDRIPQAPGAEMSAFNRFNHERGKIHGHAAFEQLDTRAPELLAQAGWTRDEYRDFTSWLVVDENDYPLEKVERLLATGGLPEVITVDWSVHQLRSVVTDSAASVFLFLGVVATGVVLALLGLIPRTRGLAFFLGYLVFLIAVTLWMAAHFRFPQRVSLSFFTVAALGAFLYVVRAIADGPAMREVPQARKRVAMVGLTVITFMVLCWARHLGGWLDQGTSPDRDTMQALEDRVAARRGFVFVYVQAGLVELDPLRAQPRAFDGLQGGWGTFSASWYDTIKRLGVTRGADVLPAMVNNPNAYVLGPLGARSVLEDWIRRKVKNPAVRLAIVDGAEMSGGNRPELYRVVTTPLTRDSEEWRWLEHDYRASVARLSGPPDVRDFMFQPIPIAPPYEQHVSKLSHPKARVDVAAIDDGIRSTVTSDTTDSCFVTDIDGHQAGMVVPIQSLHAARFTVRLIHPENVIGFDVHALSKTSRSVRWRWQLDEHAQRFGFDGTFTLVPGSSDHQLRLAVNSARPSDLRELHIFLAVKPGTQAGFELRKLEIAP